VGHSFQALRVRILPPVLCVLLCASVGFGSWYLYTYKDPSTRIGIVSWRDSEHWKIIDVEQISGSGMFSVVVRNGVGQKAYAIAKTPFYSFVGGSVRLGSLSLPSGNGGYKTIYIISAPVEGPYDICRKIPKKGGSNI
jgi:hypothetical protein